MTTQELTIRFPNVSPDIAGARAEALATEIRRQVRDQGKRVDPQVVRTDPTAQDFGTTIVLVLGAPAVIVLANAIRGWARRTDNADIEINGARITNVNTGDVANIISTLNQKK